MFSSSLNNFTKLTQVAITFTNNLVILLKAHQKYIFVQVACLHVTRNILLVELFFKFKSVLYLLAVAEPQDASPHSYYVSYKTVRWSPKWHKINIFLENCQYASITLSALYSPPNHSSLRPFGWPNFHL